jgi:pimeloyl-ACP methyl ester carboxylesterase
VRSLGQELPYVADLFAREGLMEVEGSDGVEWSWRFDPRTRTRFDRGDATIAAMGCPLSLIFGDRSIVVPPATRVAILEVAPAHTRAIVIPDCGHHVMAEQPIALIAALQALI